ncbi:MAG: helix-turn-helix transcriptional regulator, partial [Phycisphaeraceae bacterium]|nr:helix-turn-helix transcriptional regulator [Phycisphaeraceae bacterium]
IFHGTIQSPAIVYDLIEKLSLMLCNTNTHEQLASRGVLLELLIRLLDPQPNHSPQQHRQEELAHDVRNELDQALSQPRKSIEIRKLLGSMGHSYEHLARVFRQQYGLTPTDYVQSIRIERAKHLLRHTNMKVSAIAQSVGYQDAIYFSRLFKRHTHLSPGKFRR